MGAQALGHVILESNLRPTLSNHGVIIQLHSKSLSFLHLDGEKVLGHKDVVRIKTQ